MTTLLSRLRKPGISVATAAAMMAGASFCVMTNPAYSGEVNKVAEHCLKIKDTATRAGCWVDALDKNTKALKVEGDRARAAGAAADKELSAIEQSEVCFTFLKKGTTDKKFTREAVLQTAGGRLTPDNACDVARKHGYGQRVSVDAPTVR